MNISKLDEERKLAILNAALKEFVTKGYDAASTNIIAKEAGISKALMFHYVENKQELFLFVYRYFKQLLDEHYYQKLDTREQELFSKLRQSYLLQIDLIRQYPAILEFDKLTEPTNSHVINEILLHENQQNNLAECSAILDTIDESHFRKELDKNICKQFITWANIGFTTQILQEIKRSGADSFDSEKIIEHLDAYFDELRKIFYSPLEKMN
ncbi:hypothetical protein BAU15_06565 [Enterococcus sp. JM4C]|uniref:TetR/AcrR family transcriptional regulator n=1 Tax=Candidatus Enterococcus huntleyi TaxID=1857217 RepID=UPI00137B8A56|nr:TetR/AcrR family transcriptional regulator [Enterococcus sp. JM4C]KAF1297206.1 hypothetical protein BAU15_06565 [Enterococcus sp. JM4C]